VRCKCAGVLICSATGTNCVETLTAIFGRQINTSLQHTLKHTSVRLVAERVVPGVTNKLAASINIPQTME
jgi:hypothetical protein